MLNTFLLTRKSNYTVEFTESFVFRAADRDLARAAGVEGADGGVGEG